MLIESPTFTKSRFMADSAIYFTKLFCGCYSYVTCLEFSQDLEALRKYPITCPRFVPSYGLTTEIFLSSLLEVRVMDWVKRQTFSSSLLDNIS